MLYRSNGVAEPISTMGASGVRSLERIGPGMKRGEHEVRLFTFFGSPAGQFLLLDKVR